MSLDRYDIKSKIGEGGVGAVYRAFDRNLNRDVAIKRVLANGEYANQEEATQRMLKEATALCSVQHPHIVTVYDAGVDKDGPYVVMELLSGRTIDEMVQKGVLTKEEFRELAVQSQEALIAAQELNLVHRDIKPSNLMVTWLPSGRFHTKLVDFGLAKFSASPSHQTIDHGDAVFGSIRFMAPEQFERTPLDKRTDMYAIGCVYYYCLTGRYPFDGETAAQVMSAHLQHQVTPISELRPDLPDWLCDWVMWHISRSMDDRPADAQNSLTKFLMSENNPEAGTPEVPQAASPSEAPAPQADSNPPAEVATPPVDPATAPQPVQAATPAPQATKPTLVIPGQQPAQPAPVQPAAPVTETTAPQPVAAVPQMTPAPVPQAAPVPAPQVAPAQPAAPAPVLQTAPVPQAAPAQPEPAQPAPAPQAAPVQPAAPVLQTAPVPQAAPAPVQPAAPAPVLQTAPVPQAAPAPVQPAAPVLQTAPVPQAAPAQPTAAVSQAAPTPAPQITVPLSGTPATPAPAAQPAAPAANPLLVAGAAAVATAPQPAMQPASPVGAPPQPAAPLGAPNSGGVGIGSVVVAPKKGISNAVKGMIITALVAGLIVAGVVWKGTTNNNDRIARLNEITSVFQDPNNIPDEIPLSESDVQLLLDELTTADVKDKLERPTYLQALTKGSASDGVDISAKIAGYAKDVDMESALRIKLFQVVGLRAEESALPALIDFAKSTSDTGAGQAAIAAAKNMATASNFKSLLAIVTGSENASIKSSAVGVLTKVVGESDDPGSYAKAIVGTYNGTPDEDGRIALLSLMGAAGGDEAAGIVSEKLDGDNPKLKVAAIYALRSWPDETQFDTLYDFANDTEDDRLRKDAFESLVGFLKDGPKMDEDDKSLYWYEVASIATGEIEQRNVIGTMVSQTGDWADDVLDYFVELGDSDGVQAAAEKAKYNLYERKKRSGRKRPSKRSKDKDEDEDEE